MEIEFDFLMIIWEKSTNIENRAQIRPILYSSQPIRLQIFFCVSNNIRQLIKSSVTKVSVIIFIFSNIYVSYNDFDRQNPNTINGILWSATNIGIA